MFIWIAATLVIGMCVLSVIVSFTRRAGLRDLGAVSTQWLAEHREYRDGDRSR